MASLIVFQDRKPGVHTVFPRYNAPRYKTGSGIRGRRATGMEVEERREEGWSVGEEVYDRTT